MGNDEKGMLQENENEIDLMSVISVLLKRKRLIAGIVGSCMVIAMFYIYFTSRSCTQELIQLSFSGIDKHRYPDGSQFNMSDLIAQDILVKAAEVIDNKDHRNIFLDKPRSYIVIDPFIPIEVREKARWMEKQKQTYFYLPSQFSISFNQRRGGTFSSEERKQVLMAINEAYRTKFLREYVDLPLLAINLDKQFFSENDYMDVLDTMVQYINNYSKFLNERIRETGFFRSSQNGLSFVDALDSLHTIKDIDLYGVESVLKTMMKTKHKDSLIKKYQHRITLMEQDMEKKEEEAKIARELLKEVLQKEGGGVASRSQGGSQPQVIMDSSLMNKLTEKDYKSTLLQRALEAEVAARSLQVDKKYLEKDLAALMKNTEIDPRDSNFSNEYIQNELIRVGGKLIDIGKMANNINREYLTKKFSNIIQVIKQPYSLTKYQRNPRMILALTLIISLIVSFSIALFIESLIGYGKNLNGHT